MSSLQNVIELWSMVQHMTELPVPTTGSMVTARTSQKMQTTIVKQAMSYLQERYVKHMYTALI